MLLGVRRAPQGPQLRFMRALPPGVEALSVRLAVPFRTLSEDQLSAYYYTYHRNKKAYKKLP